MPTTTKEQPRTRDMSRAHEGRRTAARTRRFAGYVAEMRAAGLAVTVVETVAGEAYDGERELFRP